MDQSREDLGPDRRSRENDHSRQDKETGEGPRRHGSVRNVGRGASAEVCRHKGFLLCAKGQPAHARVRIAPVDTHACERKRNCTAGGVTASAINLAS